MDLLIETDDAVVGIENKLFAAFQKDQPRKYLDTVRSYAEDLAKLRRQKSLDYFVAILAPENRRPGILKLIGENRHLTFVPWEKVLESLGQAGDRPDPITDTVRTSFIQLMRDKMAFMPEFSGWFPHLRAGFDEFGTPLQRRVVGHLWELFPDPGRGLSKNKTSVGYYFCASSKEDSAWFGFVPADREIESGAREPAELIVATSFDVSLPPPYFRPLKLRSPNFLGRRTVQGAWAIDYDRDWSTPEKWREVLAPLNTRVEELLQRSRDTAIATEPPRAPDSAQPT